MLKYLVQDFIAMACYIPYGLIIAFSFGFLGLWINAGRKARGREKVPVLSRVCFWTYLALMIIITFLSRESGGEIGKIDLELGSTLKINARNDAYLVENILLFIPFGFCLIWNRTGRGFFCYSLFWSFTTSFCIEIMQLITGRGIFQLDDILTNTLGGIVGAFLYKCISLLFGKKR